MSKYYLNYLDELESEAFLYYEKFGHNFKIL